MRILLGRTAGRSVKCRVDRGHVASLTEEVRRLPASSRDGVGLVIVRGADPDEACLSRQGSRHLGVLLDALFRDAPTDAADEQWSSAIPNSRERYREQWIGPEPLEVHPVADDP